MKMILDWKSVSNKNFNKIKKSGRPLPGHWDQVSFYARHYGAPRAGVVYYGKPADGTLPDVLDPQRLLAYSGDIEAVPHSYDIGAHVVRTHHEAGTLPAFETILACRWCGVKAACVRAMPQEQEFGSKIVGTTFAPDFAAAVPTLKPGEPLRLVHNPANEYGSRLPDAPDQGAAIEVRREDGTMLGHLPDEGSGSPTAQLVAHHLRAGGQAVAAVREVTGGVEGKENFGVNVLVMLSA